MTDVSTAPSLRGPPARCRLFRACPPWIFRHPLTVPTRRGRTGADGPSPDPRVAPPLPPCRLDDAGVRRRRRPPPHRPVMPPGCVSRGIGGEGERGVSMANSPRGVHPQRRSLRARVRARRHHGIHVCVGAGTCRDPLVGRPCSTVSGATGNTRATTRERDVDALSDGRIATGRGGRDTTEDDSRDLLESEVFISC